MFVDEDKARGKTVNFYGSDTILLNYIIPITKHHSSYKDINTNDVLISWDVYKAKGGWLSHLIGFPEGNPPYTFNGVCGPSNFNKSIYSDLNITVID